MARERECERERRALELAHDEDAVTAAPGRSVALTAGGAVAAVAVCAAIALLARRRYPSG